MNNRLRELRVESGLTQKQLAEKLKSTDKNIWAYEKGNVSPPTEILIAYAQYFEVSTDYLLGLERDYGNIVIKKETPQLSAEELKIIENFRELNPSGQKLVKQTIDTLRTPSIQNNTKKRL